jgi:hypothetical protein
MINTRYVGQSYHLGPAVIRALRSLTHDHANQIEDAVQASAPEWDVDRIDDYNGYLAVLVSRKDDIDTEPSYLISGTVDRVELAKIRADTLREVGPFKTVEQAIEALVALLTARAGR